MLFSLVSTEILPVLFWIDPLYLLSSGYVYRADVVSLIMDDRHGGAEQRHREMDWCEDDWIVKSFIE